MFHFLSCVLWRTQQRMLHICLIDSGSSKDKVSSLKPNSCFKCSSICARSTILSETHKKGLYSVSWRCTWFLLPHWTYCGSWNFSRKFPNTKSQGNIDSLYLCVTAYMMWQVLEWQIISMIQLGYYSGIIVPVFQQSAQSNSWQTRGECLCVLCVLKRWKIVVCL